MHNRICQIPKLLIVLLCFYLPTPAVAAIKILDITGAYSGKEIAASATATIYVGRTGTCATAGSVSETCNACEGVTLGSASCSLRYVKDNSEVTIRFESDADGGGAAVAQQADGDPINPVSATSDVKKGQPSTIVLNWTNLCTIATGGVCPTSGFQTASFKVGTTNNLATITVYFQTMTGTTTTCATAAAGSGACDFSIFPGDEKVYLSLDVSDSSYPTKTSGVSYRAVRLFNVPCATATSVTDSSFTFSTEYKDVGVSPKTEGGVEYEDQIDGFVNDTYYCFRMANIDKAENIGIVTSYDSNNPRYRQQPSEVIGLLTKEANCFIATAAYGSALEPHVQTLRAFRGKYLMTNEVGRTFVRAYYRYSPPVANWIKDHEWARTAVRFLLWPIWAFAYLSISYSLLLTALSFLSLLILASLFWRKQKLSPLQHETLRIQLTTDQNLEDYLSSLNLKKYFITTLPKLIRNRLILFFLVLFVGLFVQGLRAQEPEDVFLPEEDTPPAEAPYLAPTDEPVPVTQAPQKTVPLTSEKKAAIQERLKKVEKSIATDQQKLNEDNQRIEDLKRQADEIEAKQRERRLSIGSKKDRLLELEKQTLPPAKISKRKREILYPLTETPQKYAASFRIGSYRPPALRNGETGLNFNQIYTESAGIILFTDFEWQLLQSVGKLGLKLGTGVFTTSGSGRFKSRPQTSAREQYTFLMFPNLVGGIYRLDYWKKQYFVPFAEAGGGYFTFAEIRDDYKRTKYGGAAVGYFAVGGSLLLDFITPAAIAEMDMDYGINHMYLTAEYRVIEGLDSDFDFSNDTFSAGFLIEF
jgi:hypothetical protein